MATKRKFNATKEDEQGVNGQTSWNPQISNPAAFHMNNSYTPMATAHVNDNQLTPAVSLSAMIELIQGMLQKRGVWCQNNQEVVEAAAAKKLKTDEVTTFSNGPSFVYTPVEVTSMAVSMSIDEIESTRQRLRVVLTVEASKQRSELLESFTLSLEEDDNNNAMTDDNNNWMMEYKAANPNVRKDMIDILVESYIETKIHGSVQIVNSRNCSAVRGDMKQALVDKLDLKLCCLVHIQLQEHLDAIQASPITVLKAINHIATAFANRTTVENAMAILAMD